MDEDVPVTFQTSTTEMISGQLWTPTLRRLMINELLLTCGRRSTSRKLTLILNALGPMAVDHRNCGVAPQFTAIRCTNHSRNGFCQPAPCTPVGAGPVFRHGPFRQGFVG